ncbi:uncharacterized protein DS421_14g469850 [Arachis hypogaea]|nr:uncharacterized protein DS421_14g469850 [Arachis hypogaea]
MLLKLWLLRSPFSCFFSGRAAVFAVITFACHSSPLAEGAWNTNHDVVAAE